MDLKTWINEYRNQEDIDLFNELYEEITKDNMKPLEFTINKINYFRGNKDVIEIEKNLKEKGIDYSNSYYVSNVYEVFDNFRSDLTCSFLHYFITEKDNNPKEKFDNEIAKYDSFLKKIKILDEKTKYQKKVYNKSFNGDIVITDPCYIERFDNNFQIELNGDTIYGDWSCTVFDKDTKKSIGKFCADSGKVCICELNEIKNKEKFLEWVDSHSHCTSIIKGFKGNVSLIYDYEEYEHNGKNYKDLYCYVEGEGNINFTSRQTGF